MIINEDTNQCDLCSVEFEAGGVEGITPTLDGKIFDICNDCSLVNDLAECGSAIYGHLCPYSETDGKDYLCAICRGEPRKPDIAHAFDDVVRRLKAVQGR